MSTHAPGNSEERRRFDVGPCIGRGGFGEVYLATMVSGGGVRAEVALKVLHRGLDPRSQAVRRLADEAKLLGLLNHPNILRIHDLVLLDGRITLVTEYVAGADLDQCVVGAAEPMTPRALLQVTGAVAAALHTAYHTAGPDGQPLHLLHRDIKPSNIRVGRHGEVKLLDFGIAKAAGEREAKTQTNALIGSFSYMSPERLDREGNDDAPGDVFALGCTLYEMLRGEMLFDGTIRELYRLAMDEPKHSAYVQAHVNEVDTDPAVHALLLDLLAYEPDAPPPLMDLAERCEDLADELSGLTLSRWCRNRDWGDPDALQGELTGRSITETNLTASLLDAQLTGEIERPGSSTPVDPTRATGQYEGDTPDDGNTSDTFAWSPTEGATTGTEPAPPPDGASSSETSLLPLGDEPRRGMPLWAKLAIMLVVGLAIGLGGATAVLGIGGMAWLAALTPVEVGDEPLGGDEPAGDPGNEEPPEAADPVGSDPVGSDPVGSDPLGSDPARPQDPSAPDGGDPVGSDPVDGDPDDGVAEVDPDLGAPGLDVCGAPETLEGPSTAGQLSPRARRCLAGILTNQQMAQVDRDKLGRILLIDAKTRCDTQSDCGDYELHQRVFFEEVSRSDAELLYAFSLHLSGRATTDTARAEALSWTYRALERKSSWSGRTHVKRVGALMEQKAKLSYDRWEAEPRNERLRVEARNGSVEWMNHLIQLGRPHAQALSMCASIEGSEAACSGRANDVGATFVVTFTSQPEGAMVYIGGQQVGITPYQAELGSGAHQVRMTHGGVEGRQSITVDADQPTKWVWTAQTDRWSSVF